MMPNPNSYMNMYNERMMKRGQQYSNNAQARTYQDYMRNIQAQRQAAGQTFGNLAMQQQNQSFYDRAAGRPPGLSGGMSNQFTNQVSAARSRQLGQVAQQRYQAFSDIAQQQAQAGQFARAQAMQEQEFQTKEIALQQQKYAQAQQIMESANLTDEQKQSQLSRLGLTQGEISRMGPQPGEGIVGAATTAAGLGAVSAGVGEYKKIQSVENVLRADKGVQEAMGKYNKAAKGSVERLQAQDELIKKRQEVISKITNDKAPKKLRIAEARANKWGKQLESTTKKVDKLIAKKERLGAKFSAKDTTKLKNLQLKKGALKTKADMAKKFMAESKYNQLLQTGGKKGIAKAYSGGAKIAVSGAKGGVLSSAGGKLLAVGGKIFAAYLVVDIAARLLTGSGAIEGLSNIISGKEFGKGGILSL